MKQVIKDCKNMIMKKVGILCILLFILLIAMAWLWGSDIFSLCKGPVELTEMEESLVNEKEAADVAHAYIERDVEMIVGSYAEYQKQNQGDKEVYYLMPIQDGTYFITIIADSSMIPTFDKMETAFYNSIGKEDKEYPETVHIKGGFRLLNDEEKSYALDFYTGYDEHVTTIDDLSNILFPYAIEIGNIGTVPIDNLWILFIAWILILLVFAILTVLYYTNFFLRTLQKDFLFLSENEKEEMDEDYKNAEEKFHTKFGKRMLYKKEAFTLRVFSYENMIWLYKKEVLAKNKRNIQVYAYDQRGIQHVLYQSESEKQAEEYLQFLFDHCKEAILGYQEYLYEAWKTKPKKLAVKIAELKSLEKHEEIKKKKAKPKSAEHKEQKKIKKRKVISDNAKDEKSEDEHKNIEK